MKKRESLSYWQFWSPKYWPLWLALGLAKLIAHLPLRVQWGLGALLGKLAHALMKSRRVVTQQNIAACFPELSPEEQAELVKKSFRSNGIGMVEGLRSWFISPERLRDRADFVGLEHLDTAKARGKGVILLGGHFSTLDLVGNLTTLYFEADVMQRDHSNPLFNAFMTRSRAGLYDTVLEKRDVRGLLTCLKNNRVVWYATDQDYGRKRTVFAPFFGIECANLTSTMKIAESSGAAVVPFSHFRHEDTGRYEVIIHPPLEDFPTESLEADAARLNLILENEIRKAPEQYLWMHRRFKTVPDPDAKNIYGKVSR